MKTIMIPLVFGFMLISQISHGQTQSFTVSGQGVTYLIMPPSECKDETALRSLGRTVELAIPVAEQNANEAKRDWDKNQKDISDYNVRLELYYTARKQTDEKIAAFNEERAEYEVDLAIVNADVNEYNSRDEQFRDQATYDRLSAEVSRLNNWWTSLENQRQDLLMIDTGLENTRVSLTNESEALNREYDRIKIAMKTAYEQLLNCKSAAEEINTLLAGKYKVYGFIGPYYLDITDEKIKELSNLIFDGNNYER